MINASIMYKKANYVEWNKTEKASSYLMLQSHKFTSNSTKYSYQSIFIIIMSSGNFLMKIKSLQSILKPVWRFVLQGLV